MSERNPAFLAASALGHSLVHKPHREVPCRWQCTLCGWLAIEWDRQVYGTAVEGECPGDAS